MGINMTRLSFNVLGSFLVFFHSGPYYYWGNLSVYIMSYALRGQQQISTVNLPVTYHKDSNSDITRPALALTFFTPSWLMAMLFGGYLTSKNVVHPRILISIAIILQNLSFIACYALIDVNLTVVFTIFGLLVGFGTRQAFVTSLVLSGGAAGGVVIVLFVTGYTNPNNLPLTSHYGETQIFQQEEILDKVPAMLFIMAGSLTAIQFFGLGLLSDGDEERRVFTFLRKENVKDIVVEEESILFPQSTVKEYKSTSTGDSRVFKELTEIGQGEIKTTEQQESYTPGQLIKSPIYYKLFSIYMLGVTARLVVTTYYKLYGQELIPDDHFLTLLGIAEALCVIPSSLAWGAVMDRMGVKLTLVYMYSCIPVSLLLMYFSAHWNKWAYFIASLSATACANVYVCFSVATLLWFGKDYYAINMPIVESSAILGVMVTSSFLDTLIDKFGHFAEFCLSSSLCVVGLLVITLTLPHKFNKS